MRNDYCQYFVDTGDRPQNFIRDIHPDRRFHDYPKLNELIKLKNEIKGFRSHPAIYLKQDIRTFPVENLGKFDVLLVDPPWEEYKNNSSQLPVLKNKEKLSNWTLEEISQIKITQLAQTPSFIFL